MPRRYTLALVTSGSPTRFDTTRLARNEKDDGGRPNEGTGQGTLSEVPGNDRARGQNWTAYTHTKRGWIEGTDYGDEVRRIEPYDSIHLFARSGVRSVTTEKVPLSGTSYPLEEIVCHRALAWGSLTRIRRGYHFSRPKNVVEEELQNAIIRCSFRDVGWLWSKKAYIVLANHNVPIVLIEDYRQSTRQVVTEESAYPCETEAVYITWRYTWTGSWTIWTENELIGVVDNLMYRRSGNQTT